MKRLVNLITLALFFLSLTVYPSLVQGKTSDSPEENVVDYAPVSNDVLGLTPEQKAKLEEFRKARREEQKAHFDKIRKLRQELRELMEDPEANEKDILNLYEQMSGLRAERFKNSLRERHEFRKILTPEQLEKLDKFKSRMVRSLSWAKRDGRTRPFSSSGQDESLLGERRPFWSASAPALVVALAQVIGEDCQRSTAERAELYEARSLIGLFFYLIFSRGVLFLFHEK